MTQTYEKVIEIESPKVEQIEEVSKESEVDELLGDLNPRYFEEIHSLEDAKQKIYCKNVNFGFDFNLDRAY